MVMKETCLHDKHVALGALMSPFGGFDMPIQYSGIIDEHNAVRQHVGMFDVSHMGEVRITGPEAEKYVNYIFTNDVRPMASGKVIYGMFCYEDGGVVDDTCICKLEENHYIFTINAANIDKDVEWFKKQTEGFDVVLSHESDYYGQLAIQGPEAEATIEKVLEIACSDLKFYEEPAMSGTVLLLPGDMIVVAPEDAHKPRCAAGEPEFVRKVVVKVKV
ncbi:MAG: DUF386 family protein [Prevotella sp.]|nr:DUF386 family protein [Prevotella sp.]